MDNSINIAAILIANCTGIFCLMFLICSRYAGKPDKSAGDYLFNGLMVIDIASLLMETVSFLIDGSPGKFIHFLQYVSNAWLFFSAILAGYVWCLFVEFKVYNSFRRVRKMALILAVPLSVCFVLVIANCFFDGLIFSVSQDNVYQRGRMAGVCYVLICVYYIFSAVSVHIAKHKGRKIRFFPVYTFVLPCAAGTIVQGLCYGVSTGWFSGAIAILLVQIQLQKEESLIDELSGLYNRKYLEFYFKQFRLKKNTQIFGIMIDINFFKKINDSFGHTAGDAAIRLTGKMLSEWVDDTDTVIRFAGDEFVIICEERTGDEVEALIAGIKRRLSDYNKSSGLPYELSFSMGYTEYCGEHMKLDDFLHDMDRMMYEDKEEYHNNCTRI